jgi:hypothetical protein
MKQGNQQDGSQELDAAAKQTVWPFLRGGGCGVPGWTPQEREHESSFCLVCRFLAVMLEIPVPSQVRRGKSLPTGTIEEIKGERRKMDPGFEKSEKKSSQR